MGVQDPSVLLPIADFRHQPALGPESPPSRFLTRKSYESVIERVAEPNREEQPNKTCRDGAASEYSARRNEPFAWSTTTLHLRLIVP